MAFSYSAYGLQLCSNAPIPRLDESPASNAVDVQIWLDPRLARVDQATEEEEPLYLSTGSDAYGNPSVTMLKSSSGSYSRIRYADGAEFVVDRAGTQVWATWGQALTVEDAVVYLLGPIMGFVLRQRGLTSLHASAVAIDDHAIVFLGPPGAGKSTTAAAFAQLGYSVVSDDIVPVCETGHTFTVHSGYPCVCLWPESVRSLYGSSDALPQLTPGWEKRYLRLANGKNQFQRGPLPLATVYVLGARNQEPLVTLVEPLPPEKALIGLLANTYMNYIPGRKARAREFDLLSRLVLSVPVRKLQPRDDPACLTRFCETIVKDLRCMRSSGAEAHGGA